VADHREAAVAAALLSQEAKVPVAAEEHHCQGTRSPAAAFRTQEALLEALLETPAAASWAAHQDSRAWAAGSQAEHPGGDASVAALPAAFRALRQAVVRHMASPDASAAAFLAFLVAAFLAFLVAAFLAFRAAAGRSQEEEAAAL